MAEWQITKPSNKGGYDHEFVEVPPKSLECPICLLTLRDPHVISCCGNHFCRPCIERVRRDKKPCPLCNEGDFTIFLHKGVVREVNALAIWCPQKVLGCQWKGELGSAKSHETGCGFVEVGCVYGCGEHFLRKLMAEHEVTCSKRPIEMQLSSIVQKMDAVLADNRALKEVVQALKEETRLLKEENYSLKEDVSRMKQASAAVENDVRRVGRKLRAISDVVAPVPPQWFIVYDVEHLRKGRRMWASPIFYSHDGGYKMKVVIYPNGYGPSVGKGIAFFAGVAVGEYDDELQWPFLGSVTIQVLNRVSDEWEEERTIDFARGLKTCTRKPNPKHPNDYCGHSSYLPHTKLKLYTGEVDALRIRVACVKLY